MLGRREGLVRHRPRARPGRDVADVVGARWISAHAIDAEAVAGDFAMDGFTRTCLTAPLALRRTVWFISLTRLTGSATTSGHRSPVMR